MRLERLCNIADLEERRPVRFKAGGHNLCVVLSEGKVVAFENRCPHTGARLDEGRVRRNVLTCPAHLAQFDLVTGEVLSYPMEGGPARDQTGPLCRYGVEVDDDGWISVDTGSTRQARAS